ncbi:MAG: hypothetical protein Q4G71_06930 [Pseudomonadota bacterium]|nr:hypothetical protein [Pseudomonadota bacterium]
MQVSRPTSAAATATVRRAVHQALPQQSHIMQMAPAQRQVMADVLINGTMLIVARYVNAVDTGNTRQQRAAAQDAADFVQALAGIDLRGLRLTDKGLE